MAATDIGVAGANSATKIMTYRDASGVHSAKIKVEDNVQVLLSWKRREGSSERWVASALDTQIRGDDIGYSRDGTTLSFSGQVLAGPVMPGSVVVEATDGSPAAQDLNMDGIMYLNGAARHRAASGTFAAMAGESMIVKIDDGPNQTVTFGTEATIAAAVALINATLKPGIAVAQGVQDVDLLSESTGIGSSVQVVSVDAGITTKLGISAGTSTTVAGSVNYFTGALALSYPGGYAPSTGDSAASVMGTVAGPWSMSPGDTLVVDTNGGGDETATFDAGQATYNGLGGSFAASAGESMVVKVDGGANQTLTMGAGTETTLATYVAKLNSALAGAHAVANANSLEGVLGVINEMKADYTAHIADVTSHTNADAVNTVSAASATDLASAQTLANELKADLNAHLIALSEAEECITLVNELKADYNAHCAALSQEEEMVALVNEIKADYNAHCTAVSTLEECITLLNEIKADYNAHRVLLTAHSIANTTEAVTSADATDLASAYTLANEVKADYNGHRTDASEDSHPTDDDTNVVTAADADTLAKLVTLSNDIRTQYVAHIASASFHLAADETNTVSAPAAETNAIHLIDCTVTATSADATDEASAITLANEIKADYNDHRTDVTDECHSTDDDTNTIASADATDTASLITLLNELKTDINAHMASAVFHVNADSTVIAADNPGTASVHLIACTVTASSADATDLASAYTLANELKADYNDHRTDVTNDCHGADDDTNVIAAANATTLDTLITLVTELKADYNAHIANTGGSFHATADAVNVATSDDPQTAAVHEQDDTTNTIAAADASDLASLLTLAAELKLDYNAHLSQANVHDADDTTNTVAATPDGVSLVSDTYGTSGSILVVTAGATIAAKTGLQQGGSASGTGDVADISAVTPAEAKALIEADTTGLTVTLVENKLQLTAATSVNVNASSDLEGTFGLSTTIATATSGGSAPLQIDYMQTTALSGLSRNLIRLGNVTAQSELLLYALGQNAAAKIQASIDRLQFD
jgi:hypothetical protein